MRDRYGREINYIRVSVTDRCNLRCVYCMPSGGVPLLDHEEILAYEEILAVLAAARRKGFGHVRITGGEPLVRKDLDELVRGVKGLGFEDISVTTNGTLLASHATVLRKSGLNRINVSLDTLHPDRFSRITRVGRVEDPLRGIESAINAGLSPVKVNVVVMDGWNFDEVAELARLAVEMPVHVRFIEYMPVGSSQGVETISGVPSKLVMSEISRAFRQQLKRCPGPPGAGPAVAYRLEGAKGTVGFISAVSGPFCDSCNRLRLTADGKLRPCLGSPVEVDVKDVLRRSSSREAAGRVERALERAVLLKPRARQGWDCTGARRMCQIGG